MSKYFIIAFLATFALANAYSNPNDVNAQILKYDNQVNEDGSYNYAYDSSNGIAVQEAGVGGYYANGGYSYYSPEGELVQISYAANENGFQPSGSHIPTPPPIPPQILRALEYIRTHPQYDESQSQQQSQYRNFNTFNGKKRVK